MKSNEPKIILLCRNIARYEKYKQTNKTKKPGIRAVRFVLGCHYVILLETNNGTVVNPIRVYTGAIHGTAL